MKASLKYLATLLLLLPQLGQLQVLEPTSVTDWDGAAEQLRARQMQWASHNIRSYSIDIDKGCFSCWRSYPARVSIIGDRVIAAVRSMEKNPHPRVFDPDFGEYVRVLDASYETVGELFAVVERAIDNHWGTTHPGSKAALFVQYDPVHGYPNFIYVSYSRVLNPDGSVGSITDSETIYLVSGLAPAP